MRVLFEVLNEGGATDWQGHVIRLVKEHERTKPKQHPVAWASESIVAQEGRRSRAPAI